MRERITAAVYAYALHTAYTCRHGFIGRHLSFLIDRHQYKSMMQFLTANEIHRGINVKNKKSGSDFSLPLRFRDQDSNLDTRHQKPMSCH